MPYLSSADDQRCRVLKRGLLACRFLASEPLTLAALGNLMGVDNRTARRYVYALRAVGIDVYECEGPGPAKAWRLDRLAWSAALDLPQD